MHLTSTQLTQLKTGCCLYSYEYHHNSLILIFGSCCELPPPPPSSLPTYLLLLKMHENVARGQIKVAGRALNIRLQVGTIGWSDLPLFAIFDIGHITANQVYFYEFNSKNSANLTVPVRQSFYFQNITEIIKMHIFFENM